MGGYILLTDDELQVIVDMARRQYNATDEEVERYILQQLLLKLGLPKGVNP